MKYRHGKGSQDYCSKIAASQYGSWLESSAAAMGARFMRSINYL